MSYLIPIIFLFIIISAMRSNIPVYTTFCDGVQWGMKTVIGIFPVILAVTTAVSMMRASGLTEIIISFLSPITDIFHIPTEVLPLALIRPLSGGGALGILSNILKEYHPDSLIGITASVIMGSTETTFYTLMVYFKNTRVKYTGRIIPAAVFGDIVGIIAGVTASTIIF
ncbi:MAG: spore maturation protein [Clostridia bacterium]|nr:spore maturation protein [Clostridia bacterium]